jgi:hypothetical protein
VLLVLNNVFCVLDLVPLVSPFTVPASPFIVQGGLVYMGSDGKTTTCTMNDYMNKITTGILPRS